MKRNGILDKEDIIKVAEKGNYIHPEEITLDDDVDGTKAKEYLESKGFTVLKHYQTTGNKGIAVTHCGIRLCTNGYIYQSMAK